jgi:hypothetical protein
VVDIRTQVFVFRLCRFVGVLCEMLCRRHSRWTETWIFIRYLFRRSIFTLDVNRQTTRDSDRLASKAEMTRLWSVGTVFFARKVVFCQQSCWQVSAVFLLFG